MPLTYSQEGDVEDLAPEEVAQQVLQTALGTGGKRRFVEDPQGKYAIPTSFGELQKQGIPTSFEDLASRRFSLSDPNASTDPLAGVKYTIGDPIPLDQTRTQVGGAGTVVSMGFKQMAQGLTGLAYMLGLDVRGQDKQIAQSLEEDYKNLSPDVQKLVDAKWASIDENSVMQNPTAVLYQALEQMPMMLVTMGLPLTRAAMVGKSAYEALTASGMGVAEARAAASEAAGKVAAAYGAPAEGALDIGFTKQQSVDAANTTPLDQLMQVPVFKQQYDTLVQQGQTPQQAEAAARDYLGQYAISNVGDPESLTAGVVTALTAALGEQYLGRLVAGGIAGTRARRAMKGVVVEGGQEAIQNPQQQLAQNIAVQNINPSQPTFQGVGESALQGVGLGALMGGGIGAISPAERTALPPAAAPPAAQAPPAAGAPPAVAPTLPPAATPPAAGGAAVAPTLPPAATPPAAPPPTGPTAPTLPMEEGEAPPLAATAQEGATATTEQPPAAAPPAAPAIAAADAQAALESLGASDATAGGFTGLKQALVDLKTAYEEQHGTELPPIGTRFGTSKVAQFVAKAAPIIEQNVPDVTPTLQRALTAQNFASAAAQIQQITDAVRNPAIQLGQAGAPTEDLMSQLGRARARADQYANALGKRNKPSGVGLKEWAGAVGDFATGLKALMTRMQSEGTPLNAFPSNIVKTINDAQEVAQSAASPAAKNVTAGRVRTLYNRLATAAQAVEQLRAAPTTPVQSAAATPPVASAAPTAAAPSAVQTPPPAVAPPKTKGQIVKEKAAAKAAQPTKETKGEAVKKKIAEKQAANKGLAEEIRKRLASKTSFAERHGVLMERTMQELQKVAAALGVSKEGRTKGEKARAILNAVYPTESPYTAKPTAPTQAPPTPPPAPVKAEKAEKAKAVGKQKTIAKSAGLNELVVEQRVMKQEGKTLAAATGFENMADMRNTLGENSELFAKLNQKDSPWAWVYGLRQALTPAQNNELARLEKNFRTAANDVDAAGAELTIRAFLSDINGKRVPDHVVNSFMEIAKLAREVTQAAEIARDTAEEMTPGETVATDEEVASLNAVETAAEALGEELPATNETPQEELARLMAEQAADDKEEIEQEFGSETYTGDDNQDLNDYEYQQSSYMQKYDAQPTDADLHQLYSRSAGFLNSLRLLIRPWFKVGAPTSGLELNDILKKWHSMLGRNDPLRALVGRLANLNLNVKVTFAPWEARVRGEYTWRMAHDPNVPGRRLYDLRSRVLNIYTQQLGMDDLHTLLHESIHAATIYGYNENANLAKEIDLLYARAVSAWEQEVKDWDVKPIKMYGLANAHEFIAEALTNPTFQRWLSKQQAESTPFGKARSILDAFIARLKEWMGLPVRDTLLDQVISSASRTFMSEQQVRALHGKPASRITPTTLNLTRAQAIEKSVETGRIYNSKVLNALRQANYGFMDSDVIERTLRSIDEKAAAIMNWAQAPIKQFTSAVQKAEAAARDLELKAAPIIERFMKLPEQMRNALFTSELESTLNDVHADVPLNHPDNAHLFDKKGRLRKKYQQTVPGVMNDFRRLSPEAKQIYTDMKNMLQEVYWRKRGSLLRSLAERYQIPPAIVNEFANLRSEADLVAFGNKYAATQHNVNEIIPAAEKVFKATRVLGPYFPLRRYGDWVVATTDNKEKYVAFFSSEYEADKKVRELKAQGRDAAASQKISNEFLPGAAGGVVSSLTRKIKDKDVVARVRDAVTSMMADNILYGSSLKRRKIKGVDPKIMGKAFEDYIKASTGFIGNVESANDVDEAMQHLNELQAAEGQSTLNAAGMSVNDSRQFGYANEEFKRRNQELAADRHRGMLESFIGRIGFLNFLGAPSYWLLNATQTVTVGLPYMAGRLSTMLGRNVSYVQAMVALKKSYGVLRAATKGGGWKALMDLDTVINKLTPKQQQIIRQLVDDNIIGSTINHEFGNLIARQTGIPIMNKTTRFLQIVPEMVERMNRLSVALATVELGGSYQEAKDVVQATQFNYSPQNRARLLKYAPAWLGGGVRPLVQMIMMFKSYGVNMARLVYGNMYDAIKGETPQSRAEARKILAGILMSHSVFGGIYGGLGMGAAQIVGGAINAMFKPEDKIDWAEEVHKWLAQHTNDYIANIITRGAPASVGIDMSQSVNLGNLLWMTKDVNLGEPGGAETWLASLLGPVAQYGFNATRGIANAQQATVAHTLSLLLPVKLLSSLARTYDQAYNGLNTARNQNFMAPGEVSIPDMLIGSLGLRPASVSQRQQTFYAQRDYAHTLETQKAQLLQNFSSANGSDRMAARRAIVQWNNEMAQRGNRQLIINADAMTQSIQRRRDVANQYRLGKYSEYK